MKFPGIFRRVFQDARSKYFQMFCSCGDRGNCVKVANFKWLVNFRLVILFEECLRDNVHLATAGIFLKFFLYFRWSVVLRLILLFKECEENFFRECEENLLKLLI